MTPWRRVTGRARQPRKKRAPLFTCGRCHQGYSSPFGHVCAGGGDFGRRGKAQKAAKARAAAKAQRQKQAADRRQAERDRIRAAREAEQDKARKRIARVRTAERDRADQRVARARAGRAAPARAPRPAHDHRACRDQDCQRPLCLAWREALMLGQEIGYEHGFEAGAATASAEGT